jgi:hypothetical protein
VRRIPRPDLCTERTDIGVAHIVYHDEQNVGTFGGLIISIASARGGKCDGQKKEKLKSATDNSHVQLPRGIK